MYLAALSSGSQRAGVSSPSRSLAYLIPASFFFKKFFPRLDPVLAVINISMFTSAVPDVFKQTSKNPLNRKFLEKL